jgi:hypothetical protein
MADVLAMIATYRGSMESFYDCTCGADPPGPNFAATADPNGNCVANELNDAIIELRAYRGAMVMSFMVSSAFAQSNKIVFGPLLGDDAGVLNVRNADDIEIEMWVRTDPGNPTYIVGIRHGLLSEDAIIAVRNGAEIDPYYNGWEGVWVDGPYIHNPNDDYPIPPGYTCEMQCALRCVFCPPPVPPPLDTDGEWDYYGAFLMTCNTEVPIEETYYPFSMGWYPHSGNGTSWFFEAPPGGSVVPEQDYCGLYFETDAGIYIPGDVNHNGVALEMADVLAMIANYRGTMEAFYDCNCGVDPPGYRFMATADPNGNCVANELNDAIIELRAYRGAMPVSGCPDCPGSEGLSSGDRSQAPD